MPRSTSVRQLLRAWQIATAANRDRVSTREAIGRDEETRSRRLTRRTFIGSVGRATIAASALGSVRLFAAAPRVAIVGAGLAGLACADRLQSRGIAAVVYEAATRLGGRCFSNRAPRPRHGLRERRRAHRHGPQDDDRVCQRVWPGARVVREEKRPRDLLLSGARVVRGRCCGRVPRHRRGDAGRFARHQRRSDFLQ
ncbi:MAG: NAD(P)-binding protein [Acidobacteria bacterium]|nr:NAD(P)-binding protein [Acidobacteriota bacterium]